MVADTAAAPVRSSAFCYIQLLGELTVQVGGRTTTRFRTHKTVALLAYLAYRRGQRIPREVLADLFWPDSPADLGRNSLTTALSNIRKILEPPGAAAGSVVLTDHREIGLNAAAVDTDVAAFERALQEARNAAAGSAAALAALRAAVALHTQPLLPAHYDSWVAAEREWLSTACLEALETLRDAAENAGDLTGAVAWAGRMLEVDPLHENGHVSLVRLLAEAGNRSAASDHCRAWGTRLRDAGASDTAEALQQALTEFSASTRHGGLQTEALPPFPSPAAAFFGTAPSRRPSSGLALKEAPGTAVAETSAPSQAPAAASTALSSAPSIVALLPPLPVYPSRLFGRGTEIRELSWHLGDSATRLITLTGPAGVGKTRLAIAAMHELLPPPSGGPPPPDTGRSSKGSSGIEPPDDLAAFYVLTEGVANAASLADAILEAVQARLSADVTRSRDAAGRRSVETLAAVLENLQRRVLLLLDGFEHLAEEGAAIVEELLMLTQRTTVLITSRQRLYAAGERIVPVVPLPTAFTGDITLDTGATPEDLIQRSPSIALFRDRAQMARPDFELTTRNRWAVIELVARLEGLPLALELAAARSQVLTPAQMLAQLDEQDRPLDLFVSRGGARPAGRVLQRHRSLREAIAWSVQLLSPEMQQLFAQLSLLEAGWTIADAAGVCDAFGSSTGARGDAAMLEAVSVLCEASLVQADAPAAAGQAGAGGAEPGEEIRFRVLAALRAYGAELRNAQPEEALRLRHRHARYFVGEASKADQLRLDRRDAEYLDAVSLSYPNFRAVLEFGLADAANSPYALDCAIALHRYWLSRGRASEGRSYLERALCAVEASSAAATTEATTEAAAATHAGKNGFACATGYNAAGVMAAALGDFAAARRCHERALSLFQECGEDFGTAAALNNLAILHSRREEWGEARERYAQSLLYWERVGDTARCGTVEANLAGIALLQNDLSKASELYADSLATARELGDHGATATRLRNLARVAYCQRDFARSISLLHETLETPGCREDRPGAAHCLLLMGIARRAQNGGLDEPASALVQAGTKLFQECGSPLPAWEATALADFPDLLPPEETGQNESDVLPRVDVDRYVALARRSALVPTAGTAVSCSLL